MDNALEKLVSDIDIDEKCRMLLEQKVAQASEEQRAVWYVLLRGFHPDDIKDLCALLAVEDQAYAGQTSSEQMVETQERILTAMAQKMELRKRLHV